MKVSRLLAVLCFVVAATLSFAAVDARTGRTPPEPERRYVPILRTYDGDISDTSITPAVGATPAPGASPCGGFHAEMEPWLRAYGMC